MSSPFANNKMSINSCYAINFGNSMLKNFKARFKNTCVDMHLSLIFSAHFSVTSQETPTDNIANAINNTTTDNRNYFLFILTLSPGIINDEDATQQTLSLAPDNHRNIHEAFVIGQQRFRLCSMCMYHFYYVRRHTNTRPRNTIWKIIRSTNMKIRWILFFYMVSAVSLGMHLTKIVAVSSHNEQYTQFLKIWYEIAVKIYSMDAYFDGVFKMNIAKFFSSLL